MEVKSIRRFFVGFWKYQTISIGYHTTDFLFADIDSRQIIGWFYARSALVHPHGTQTANVVISAQNIA